MLGSTMVDESRSLSIVFFVSVLVACGGGPHGVLGKGAALPVVPVSSSPPIPAPSDWKGLFDSDSQSQNVPPSPASTVEVLQREPGCTRVETVTEGVFTKNGSDEDAYLLSCGATERLVIVADAAKSVPLASLDVAEDTLEAAGDMDHDGRSELLLIGHAGPRITLRAVHGAGAKLDSVYTFSMTLEPCSHTIIYYRQLSTGLDFREDKLPKRCTP